MVFTESAPLGRFSLRHRGQFFPRPLRKVIRRKILLAFGVFQRGSGVGHVRIQTIWGTFFFYSCLEFFLQWGDCLILNLLRNFSAVVLIFCFWKKGGGIPDSKTFRETFMLEFGHFFRKGGYLIPKTMRNFFLLYFSHFPRKMEEDD